MRKKKMRGKREESRRKLAEIKWQKSQQPNAHTRTHTCTHTCKRMRAWGIEQIKCKHSLTRTQTNTHAHIHNKHVLTAIAKNKKKVKTA